MSFYRDTIQTARKEHKCNICHGTIHIGEKYHDKAGKAGDNDDFWSSKECFSCQPIIAEFLESDHCDEGYCDEYIEIWWHDVKCYDCKHRWPICKPDADCNIKNPADCRDYKDGRCIGGDTCDDMTHYCRCEKFEPEVPHENN